MGGQTWTRKMKAEQVISICSNVATLNRKYSLIQSRSPNEPTVPTVIEILKALDEFMECVRYLNTRRTEAAILRLDSEAAVQDALYLMLRPWIGDLVPENPTDRIANRYTIKDFLAASARTVIEAKFIRDRDHGKLISKEMHDDIETYRHHPACSHLVFFIYDPDALIPDRAALERQVQTRRVYDDVPLNCHLVVKP
jgi:hypothetical protein